MQLYITDFYILRHIIFMLFEKYSPKFIEDMTGNSSAFQKLKKNLNTAGTFTILCGPTGSGKSSAVRLIAQELKAEITEHNPSEQSDQMKFLEKSSIQTSLFYQKKIILIEDGDSINSLRGLPNIVDICNYPVVLTCTDIYSNKIRNLKSDVIKLQKPRWDSVAKFLLRVCEKEKIPYENAAVTQIARMCNGDIRAALMDLEILSDNITLQTVSTLGNRTIQNNIFETLRTLFGTKNFSNASLSIDSCDKSIDEVLHWFSSNIPYKDNELVQAYDHISKADIFSSRIIRNQSWSLQKHVKNHLIAASVSGIETGFMRHRHP